MILWHLGVLKLLSKHHQFARLYLYLSLTAVEKTKTTVYVQIMVRQLRLYASWHNKNVIDCKQKV